MFHNRPVRPGGDVYVGYLEPSHDMVSYPRVLVWSYS